MKKKRSIDRQSVVSQAKNLMASDLDGETVMMNIKSGNYYGLNVPGSRIWGIIAQPVTITKLIELLLDEFDVSPDQCEREVMAFLRELADDNLVEVHSDAPGHHS